ncbi:MAG: adenylyl-sulfate kinase [Sneathiellaceae bacterium]
MDQSPKSAGIYPVVILGHVDHGKSTLIGRLLHDTGRLPDGKLAELEAAAKRRGAALEWAHVTDALQLERDQGITVDTTRIWFPTARRTYQIIDAPGHAEFLRNAVTGAAAAQAAILMVDISRGVEAQTRRHAYLAHLLGIRRLIVAVNKMDLVDYSSSRFSLVTSELDSYLTEIGLEADVMVPISARHGDGVAAGSADMAWWTGPTLLQALDALPAPAAPRERPLRLPVQDIYRRDDSRILVGRIEAGRVRVGDNVDIAPGGQQARVASLETWNGAVQLAAAAGESVALTLDKPVFVERGHVLVAPAAPAAQSHAVAVRLFWLDRTPLKPGDRLTFKHLTASYPVTVERIRHLVDVETLAEQDATEVPQNAVADLVLRSTRPVVFDRHDEDPATGRGVLVRDYRVAGGCLLLDGADTVKAQNITAVSTSVGPAERAAANGHLGGVIWLTGLSGAGKSTLAMGAQSLLFSRGWQVTVLDGDNLRHGLNRDLGFSAEERAENIRRTAEVARLMAESGMIVITSLISPARADRAAARQVAGGHFREVHVRADLSVCEARDPKGLYAKARAGEIRNFTGISAPYEEPERPDLAIDTGRDSVTAAIAKLVDHIDRQFGRSTASLRLSDRRVAG